MCPASETPEIQVPSQESIRPLFRMPSPTAASTPMPLGPAAAPELTKVKAYGLLGHTRSIDLQFEPQALHPERIFFFEGKRYKVVSVVELEEGQLAINAVSIESRT